MFDEYTMNRFRENMLRETERAVIHGKPNFQGIWGSNGTTATNPPAEPEPGLTLEALEAALEAARPCVRYKATDHLPAHDILGKPVFYAVHEALILFHPANLQLAQGWAKTQGVSLVEVGPGELLEARGLKVKPFKA